MKLNLGCGSEYLKGYINIDIMQGVADVVWDLNKCPYPFEDDSVDYVLAKHVLEHLDDVISVMNELHRIVKKGGGSGNKSSFLCELSGINTCTT